MYENILTEVDAGVGIITLNRPERHNAIDAAMLAELMAALAAMAADPAVRALVVSSTGKSFCAGANLDWIRSLGSQQERSDIARALGGLLSALAQMEKPTLARVQGAACGAGVGLVAACDVAIATYEARFSLPEVKLGVIPAASAAPFIAAIGQRRARRYLLTGESFAAAEAYRIGLLHEIVPDEAGLDEALGEIVNALLANDGAALAECKQLIRTIVGGGKGVTDVR